MVSILADAGFTANLIKSDLEPKQEAPFLGLFINSVSMTRKMRKANQSYQLERIDGSIQSTHPLRYHPWLAWHHYHHPMR